MVLNIKFRIVNIPAMELKSNETTTSGSRVFEDRFMERLWSYLKVQKIFYDDYANKLGPIYKTFYGRILWIFKIS
jgi:hypothetical protein